MMPRSMRFMAAGALVILTFGAVGRAVAATSEGSLLTNMATASYLSVQLTDYETTYGTSAYVLVVVPSVQIRKVATPTAECPGATVTFCIWISNASDYTSAFNVIVDDWVPDIFEYVVGQDQWAGNTAGATMTPGYSIADFLIVYCWPGAVSAKCPDGGPSSGLPLGGQVGSPLRVRWAINMIGPGQSAMACFKARIL